MGSARDAPVKLGLASDRRPGAARLLTLLCRSVVSDA